jgi:hypothetical protein
VKEKLTRVVKRLKVLKRKKYSKGSERKHCL